MLGHIGVAHVSQHPPPCTTYTAPTVGAEVNQKISRTFHSMIPQPQDGRVMAQLTEELTSIQVITQL